MSCEVTGFQVLGETHLPRENQLTLRDPYGSASVVPCETVVLLDDDEPQEQHDELQVTQECLVRGQSDKHCPTVHRQVFRVKTSGGDGGDRVSHQRRTVGGCGCVCCVPTDNDTWLKKCEA